MLYHDHSQRRRRPGDHRIWRKRRDNRLSLSTTDDNIRIATEFMGIVTIPLSIATCTGAACPEELMPAVETQAEQLASVDAHIFTRQTLTELSQKSRLVSCQGQDCPANIPQFDPSETVTLRNGHVTVEGVLTGFEADAYIVDTKDMGVVRVAADFECIGASCPAS
jgi:hypothetical protein